MKDNKVVENNKLIDRSVEGFKIFDNTYFIRERLTTSQRYAFALELVGVTHEMNEGLGVMVRSHAHEVHTMMMILKWYLDFDLGEVETFEDECNLIDLLEETGDWYDILYFVREDFEKVMGIYECAVEETKALFDAKHSLSGLIKGFLVNTISDNDHAENLQLTEYLTNLTEKAAQAEGTKVPMGSKPKGNGYSFAKKPK